MNNLLQKEVLVVMVQQPGVMAVLRQYRCSSVIGGSIILTMILS